MTLIELMFVIIVGAILASIAMVSYANYADNMKVSQAQNDIVLIQHAVERFRSSNYRVPANLAEINFDTKLDPWGRPYYYQPFFTPADYKLARKDKKLHPLNTDFDLYSAGKDGATRLPLTAKESQDDVVRANDGGFIGLASTY